MNDTESRELAARIDDELAEAELPPVKVDVVVVDDGRHYLDVQIGGRHVGLLRVNVTEAWALTVATDEWAEAAGVVEGLWEAEES
jgi:hypothetical protein